MTTLLQDLRYAARRMSQSPGFTIVVVATLALGIGANTAIFSVISAVLMKPLPYEDPSRLFRIESTGEYEFGSGPIRVEGVAYQNFVDWQPQNEAFSDMGAYGTTQFRYIGNAQPLRVDGAKVTAGFFETLGMKAIHGRLFSPADEQPDAARAVVMGYDLWQRLFGADPAVVGQTITLDEQSHAIVGVLPPGFRFPLAISEAEAFTVLRADNNEHTSRMQRWLGAVGRLKPGITHQQAQAQLDGIAARLENLYPKDNRKYKLNMMGLHEAVVGNTRSALLFLQGVVAIVLLIACANTANLFLARGTARTQELAVRSALGAGRTRLISQLLTESTLTGLLSGVVGVMLAYWGTALLVVVLPAEIPLKESIAVDHVVLGVALLASVLTGLLSGLPAAIRASRATPSASLMAGGRGVSGHGRQRLQGFFVVSQTALTLVLLVGAGLLIRSFTLLMNVDPGFVPEHVLTFRVDMSEAEQPIKRTNMLYEMLARVSALPGVQSAAACGAVPLGQGSMAGMLKILDEPKAAHRMALFCPTTESYFSTMQIPIIRGRGFTEHDTLSSGGVAVIDEIMARKVWPDEDPIGKRINMFIKQTDLTPDFYEIVGIVGGVRGNGLDTESLPQVYVPYQQHPHAGMNVALRVHGRPESLVAAIRSEAAEVMQKDAPFSFVTMEDYIAESVAGRRYPMILLGAFAALAMVLATVGIYGMLSYSVAQRTQEIGIRMALGARQRTILAMTMRQGVILTGIGIFLGIGVSLASTRLLANQLYGVGTTDFVTFAGVSLLLAAAAAAACYLPARRATKVDPMVALRCE